MREEEEETPHLLLGPLEIQSVQARKQVIKAVASSLPPEGARDP